MIPRQDIERVTEAAKIEDVVESFVPLKRRGANYLGLCPFHDEKTPSFTVTPSKNIFKCFGCGKGGDSISFLMEYNHFTYPEAIRWLAQKYGIELHETEESAQVKEIKDKKEALYNINEFAQKYFFDNLTKTQEGQSIGLSYFKERELSMKTIETWGLGYCKNQSNDFTNHALQSGYSRELLIESGLSIFSERTKDLYDRFHSRVTFPIYSPGGRVLGFSARILGKDKAKAKYVNSPESPIYTKGKVLFGLCFAKTEIVKQDQCYLVEGNVDAVMMYQKGIRNTIASSGTALTIQQVNLIKRYTKNIVILYDGDKAGIHATMRATDMFLKEGMHIKTVLFPDGDDPDSFARKHTQDEFKDFLEQNATNFILYKTNLLLEQAKDDPIKKAELIKDIVSSISLIPDLIERTTYTQQCAKLLGVQEKILAEELADKIAKNSYEESKKQADSPQPDSPAPQENKTLEERANDLLVQSTDSEDQEKAVIKILVSYADKNTNQKIVNSDGVLVDVLVNAAEFILASVSCDEILFDNPLYQKIYDLYLQSFSEDGTCPSLETLLRNEDKRIGELITSFLVNPYKVSEMWSSKYNVYVPDPDSQKIIDKDIKETLLHFKLHKIEATIASLNLQLKQCTDQEQTTELVYKIDRFTKQRNLIAKELRIIAK